MSPARKAVALLRRLWNARLVCSEVRRQSGGLLPDDWCVTELCEAEAAVARFDAKRGYWRGLRALERGGRA